MTDNVFTSTPPIYAYPAGLFQLIRLIVRKFMIFGPGHLSCLYKIIFPKNNKAKRRLCSQTFKWTFTHHSLNLVWEISSVIVWEVVQPGDLDR